MNGARQAIAAFALLALLGAGPSPHGDPAYLSVPGVTGDVTATGYKGDIELESSTIGVGRTVTNKVVPQAFTFTKDIDSASPRLLQIYTSGKPVQGTTTLYFVTTGSPSRLDATIALHDVLITADSGQGSASATETISMTYDAIEYCAYPTTATGGTSKPVCASHDFTTNTATYPRGGH